MQPSGCLRPAGHLAFAQSSPSCTCFGWQSSETEGEGKPFRAFWWCRRPLLLNSLPLGSLLRAPLAQFLFPSAGQYFFRRELAASNFFNCSWMLEIAPHAPPTIGPNERPMFISIFPASH